MSWFFSLILAILSINIDSIYSTNCTYSNASNGDTFVTYCDLNNTLRAYMKQKFDATPFHDFQGKALRLIFHDCMGQQEYNFTAPNGGATCDGCLWSQYPPNADLPTSAVKYMERVYKSQKWNKRMSRSDFWAAVATIAIQYASELAKQGLHNQPPRNDSLPYIPFYIGRSDCSAAPDINISNYKQPYKAFPDPLQGWDFNYNFFHDNYHYNEQEYIAILGGHTIGQVHSNASGFGGLNPVNTSGDPWVQGWDLLENSFYHFMIDDGEMTKGKSLDWEQVLNDNNTAGKYQYEWNNFGKPGTHRFVYLNSDMGVIFDFDSDINVTDGECACNYTSCTFNNHTDKHGQTPNYYAVMYAKNNSLWLNDFASAFIKMIRNGYDQTNKFPTDLKVLAEDWYYNSSTMSKI